jgi:hypothetical protein
MIPDGAEPYNGPRPEVVNGELVADSGLAKRWGSIPVCPRVSTWDERAACGA